MNNKLIAPIVVTIITVAILFGYLAMLLFCPGPLLVNLIGGIVVIALMGVAIYVLVERIHEIRSGEEDDLSKY